MEYREIMWATRKADIYSGPNCDEHKPLWEAYADGDKDGGDAMTEPIQLDPSFFPAGTKVVISVPICPKCGCGADNCECGFDWKKWTEELYG